MNISIGFQFGRPFHTHIHTQREPSATPHTKPVSTAADFDMKRRGRSRNSLIHMLIHRLYEEGRVGEANYAGRIDFIKRP